MLISNEIIRHKTKYWRNLMGGVDHRGFAIIYACRLEWDLSDSLLNWFAQVNPSLIQDQARKMLFNENCAFGSLEKMAIAAFHFGIIGPKTKDDLVLFAIFRNRYAHEHERNQLDVDPEMFALLQSTHLYKESADKLAKVSCENVMISIFIQLDEYIRTGIRE